MGSSSSKEALVEARNKYNKLLISCASVHNEYENNKKDENNEKRIVMDRDVYTSLCQLNKQLALEDLPTITQQDHLDELNIVKRVVCDIRYVAYKACILNLEKKIYHKCCTYNSSTEERSLYTELIKIERDNGENSVKMDTQCFRLTGDLGNENL
jgi:hypothetical protein